MSRVRRLYRGATHSEGLAVKKMRMAESKVQMPHSIDLCLKPRYRYKASWSLLGNPNSQFVRSAYRVSIMPMRYGFENTVRGSTLLGDERMALLSSISVGSLARGSRPGRL